MAHHVVEVEHVSKRYRLGPGRAGHNSLRGMLAAAPHALRRRPRAELSELWALQDVTLAIDSGEAVGLIGRNGAGKTTLLKLLARIIEPTQGVSRMRGQVGCLLEVGTGFHPELSGRDNIFLNGAILGMSRRDTQRRFDAIVEFADVGDFLDTPLKRFSSGMELRLAFAVAAHLEPDIVLVDEVLAVGDAEFRDRCLSRMTELGREGRTVVFVSHDLGAVQRLCGRSIWIDEGRISADGPTPDTISAYLARHRPQDGEIHLPPRPDQTVEIRSVSILGADGAISKPRSHDAFEIVARLEVRERLPDLDAVIYIDRADGLRVLNEGWHETGTSMPRSTPPYGLELRLSVPGVLAPGTYTIGAWLASADICFFFDEIMAFRVEPLSTDLQVSLEKNRVVRSPAGLQISLSDPPERC